MRKRTLTILLSITLPLASFALERTELLPPQAQTYMRISNTTNFWNGITKSPLGKLWKDQQIQDFLGHPESDLWKDVLFEDSSEVETEILSEQLAMLKGEVILGLDLEKSEPYILATMTENDFLRSLEMDEKLIAVEEAQFEIIKSSFQDVEIFQHIDNGGTEDESSSWQAHVGSTFIMSHEKEWIEKCIVRLKEESAKEPEGNPVCNLNLPIASLIHQIIEEEKTDSADMDDPFNIELMFEALGLMGIENFSVVIELKETELVVDSHLNATDLSKGLFTILDLRPSELPTVDFIPQNMASIEVGRFDLLRFWQEIPTVLAIAMPEVKPQFDVVLMMIQQQAGIDIEQDLLSNMGTEYVSFSVTEGSVQTSVIAVELKDAAAFRAGLETVLAAPALQPQVTAGLNIEQFLDHTIYSVKDAPPDETIAFGVTGDYLLYGQPDGIRQVIRNQSSEGAAVGAFESSPLVRGLRKQVPPGAFGFGAVDWKQYMTVVIQELAKPDYCSVVEQEWARSGPPIPPPDFDKVPPADHIASFFNVSYFYAEAVNNGIHHRIILNY